jgi:hypothetical protein
MLANKIHSAIIASTIAAAGLASAGRANADPISITAFNTFHVQNHGPLPHTPNPTLCLFEDNGAVQNTCADPVNLDFNLPVSGVGLHTIIVHNFWQQTAGTSFYCTAYACPISFGASGNHQCVVGSTETFTAASQARSLTVETEETAGTIATMQDMDVICWNVPTSAGIAILQYTP